MPVITLVIREQYADNANAVTDAENTGDLFSAGLATEANPTVQVARWSRFDDAAYSKQAHRTKDGDGNWALLDALAAWPPVADQLTADNRWGVDDRIEFEWPIGSGTVAMLAYRNKAAGYIQDDIAAAFGVTLVPLEVDDI